QEDYQNWIPYKFSLSVAKSQYVLDGLTFSLEGLKCFLGKMQFVINEKLKTSDYNIVSYCGAENEFEIVFQNTDDYFEDEIVHMQVWLNSAYLSEAQSGYAIGYKFDIRYCDLKLFAEDLRLQMNDLLDLG
ncbi:MAG: hypothetical protein K1W21_08035, partial [Oscillospiraceae bacterium]